MKEREEADFVTPGEVLGKASELRPGKGAYLSAHDKTVYASLTGFRSLTSPAAGSDDPRPTVEVKGHKAHGPVPEPGALVIARVTKVMAKMASADIICVGPKSVREKFTGIIRQQDVRATEIDKVEMHSSFRPGDVVRALVSDSYQATGCYNLLCSGFIQTNSRIAIGAAISPVSSVGANQYDITILIWKDPKLGNWWMVFGENTLVGYWPTELFTHLTDRATMVEWGGEIVNSRANGGHTSTQMGSGHFAEDGFAKASYFKNLEVVDSDNNLISARDISTMAENANCYDIKSSYNNEWGTHFYYGGPGKSPRCP